jgi:hypothetical protein
VKIAYAAKVALRELAIAAINKITAADMNEIKASVNALYDATGWASYGDTANTSEAPLVINQGVTGALTNNAATVDESQLPSGVDPFYDGTIIQPVAAGDLYIVDVHFTAASSVNDGAFEVILTNGHEQRKSVSIRRNAASHVHFSASFVVPATETDVEEGVTLSVESISGNTSIWAIEYVISRVHAAS